MSSLLEVCSGRWGCLIFQHSGCLTFGDGVVSVMMDQVPKALTNFPFILLVSKNIFSF